MRDLKYLCANGNFGGNCDIAPQKGRIFSRIVRDLMIQRIAIVCVCAAMITLSGCEFVFPDTGAADSVSLISNETVEKYRGEYEQRWRYSRLDDRLKSGYREVYAALMERFRLDEIVKITDNDGNTKEYTGTKVKLSQALRSKEEAQLMYTALIWDNPQLFYISNQYSYEGYRVGSVNYYNVFCLVLTMNASERVESERKLNTVLNEIVSPIYTPGVQMSRANQLDMQLRLHDALLERCVYETAAAEAENPMLLFPDAFTAYGALVNNAALCEGYARAMQLLMYQVGLQCTLVSGADLATGTPHMWNFVTIDGMNYHLDPTWNDGDGYFHHSFFNITTASVMRSHSIDASNVGIDTCSATDAQYYRATGKYLDTSLPEDIAGVIARCVTDGEMSVDLQFTRVTFDIAADFIANKAALITAVNSKLAGTGKHMWDYNLYKKTDYYTMSIVSV